MGRLGLKLCFSFLSFGSMEAGVVRYLVWEEQESIQLSIGSGRVGRGLSLR